LHRCGEPRAKFAEVEVVAGKLLRFEVIASTGRKMERVRAGCAEIYNKNQPDLKGEPC